MESESYSNEDQQTLRLGKLFNLFSREGDDWMMAASTKSATDASQNNELVSD